jgi:hypothetical protein
MRSLRLLRRNILQNIFFVTNMESILLIGSVALVGNFLNIKKSATPATISASDIPSTHRVVKDYSMAESARAYTQALADKKAGPGEPFLFEQYDLESDQLPFELEGNVAAGNLASGNTALGKTAAGKTAAGNLASGNLASGKTAAGKIVADPAVQFDDSIFQDVEFKGIGPSFREPGASFRDTAPSFRPGAHRTEPSEIQKNMRLEAFTGTASEFDTWMQRREVRAVVNPAEKTKKAGIMEARETRSRVENSLKARAEFDFVTPVDAQRDPRMAQGEVQIKPKNFNQLYPNQRITESAGRVNAGRLVLGEFAKHEPMNHHVAPLPERNLRDTLPGRGAATGNAVLGAPTSSFSTTAQNSWVGGARGENVYGVLLDDPGTEDRLTTMRHEVPNLPGTNPVVRQEKPAAAPRFVTRGTFKTRPGETEYVRPKTGEGAFPTRSGILPPGMTLKDFVSVSELAGQHGVQSNEKQPMYTDVHAPLTMKELSTQAHYVPAGGKDAGHGIRSHGIQSWATLKEIFSEAQHAPRHRVGVEQQPTRDAEKKVKFEVVVENTPAGHVEPEDPRFGDTKVALKAEERNAFERTPMPRSDQNTWATGGAESRSLVSHVAENDRV